MTAIYQPNSTEAPGTLVDVKGDFDTFATNVKYKTQPFGAYHCEIMNAERGYFYSDDTGRCVGMLYLRNKEHVTCELTFDNR